MSHTTVEHTIYSLLAVIWGNEMSFQKPQI